MDSNKEQEQSILIERAVKGDRQALEAVLAGVQDLVFNLALRMLGTFPDAEDAAQDIFLTPPSPGSKCRSGDPSICKPGLLQ